MNTLLALVGILCAASLFVCAFLCAAIGIADSRRPRHGSVR